MSLDKLETEQKNEHTYKLDELSPLDIVKLMNNEDMTVAVAVKQQLCEIARAIEVIAVSLESGGKLFYFGAGTSGRLGILDASECPPTFGTPPELVQGIIAGGPDAIVRAIEGAEDDFQLGVEDVNKSGVKSGDVVVGIAASGRTPYVMGALFQSQQLGAYTISLSCNSQSDISDYANIIINIVVGPEVLTGSTRLKAGTAQKMVLNMLTTGAMICLGKVYNNLMVNVQATNYKLRERVKHIIMEVTDADYKEAETLVELSGGDTKIAIVMKLKGVSAVAARGLLHQVDGRVRDALKSR